MRGQGRCKFDPFKHRLDKEAQRPDKSLYRSLRVLLPDLCLRLSPLFCNTNNYKWCAVVLLDFTMSAAHFHFPTSLLLKSARRLFTETMLPENELFTQLQTVPHMMQMKKITLYFLTFSFMTSASVCGAAL